MSVRARFAPSPTGHLHIGGARSALFNYLFAKQQGGSFILRIEDTDRERSSLEYERAIFDAFDWLGIRPDEEPRRGGAFGPYRQSERIPQYRSALGQLLAEGKAFYCDHPAATKESYGEVHWCEYRDRADRRAGIIRFKTPPDRTITFTDTIRGEVSFHTKEIGDFSIAKGVEEPLYNLANAVDDDAMGISHVLRGEEHMANTPRQILLQEGLGLRPLAYGHFALILAPDRSKLSKRHGATSVVEFREKGYLPEALINFLALLGWNPGTDQEFFSLDELIQKFSLEKVQKSGAIFDITKLDWMNGEYIRKMPRAKLVEMVTPHMKKAGLPIDSIPHEKLGAIIELEQPRLKILSEIGERVRFYFEPPLIDRELIRWKDMEDREVIESLKVSRELLQAFHEIFPSKADIELKFLAAAETLGDRGKLLWPLRVAVTGLRASPGPFDVIAILGRDEAVDRVEAAIKALTADSAS